MGLTGRIIVCHHSHVHVDGSQGDSMENSCIVRAILQKCCHISSVCKLRPLIRQL